jgi:hypothetical protein
MPTTEINNTLCHVTDIGLSDVITTYLNRDPGAVFRLLSSVTSKASLRVCLLSRKILEFAMLILLTVSLRIKLLSVSIGLSVLTARLAILFLTLGFLQAMLDAITKNSVLKYIQVEHKNRL